MASLGLDSMATDIRMTQRLLVGSLVAGFLAAVTLVLPWIRLGGRTRSSIELIGSLGALDVIEGSVKVAVIIGWFVVPVLVGTAMLTAAAGKLRLSASLLIPLGPILAGTVLFVLFVESDVLAWGAYLTALFALVATGSAIMVIVRLARR